MAMLNNQRVYSTLMGYSFLGKLSWSSMDSIPKTQTDKPKKHVPSGYLTWPCKMAHL